ncbi:hypothetical protein Zmor_000923 [Zophobas morio]|uniref:Uncharacterized protein n=1 Tax=Zophobas morio TaxID=2755281 RepID=A0AA38J5U3_9CUCU|nr:hypothetical protein Zmor_000923 [Zophobas morio]
MQRMPELQNMQCGIVKCSKSSNVSNIDFVSTAKFSVLDHDIKQDKENFDVPLELRTNIQNLSKLIEPCANISSASVAFLAGFTLKKLDDKFHCDRCLAPLLFKEVPGPLLRLILLQDRGGLTYPNAYSVSIVQEVADVTQKNVPVFKL